MVTSYVEKIVLLISLVGRSEDLAARTDRSPLIVEVVRLEGQRPSVLALWHIV